MTAVADLWRAGASRVFSGIFLSRVLGLIRDRAIAYFFGAGYHADIWRVAIRLPNVLRNLLGEGSLSASMVPIYSRLLEEGRESAARQFVGAMLGLLGLLAGGISLLGALAAPWLIEIVVPLWSDEKQGATAELVTILFPMVGLIVLSAWAMAVLDSHRRFFASYVGSGLWNLAIIVTLVAGGLRYGLGRDDLLLTMGWAALAGGALQFVVQGSLALGRIGVLRLSLGRGVGGVREAIANFVPMVAARGATNLGSWIELFMVGLLAEGAASAMGFAQTLYLVPIALFGISFAAAELPELSRMDDAYRSQLATRIRAALARLTRLTVPAVVGFLLLGDVVVAAAFQTGAFDRTATLVTWATLAAYSLGILASAVSRTLASAFYAMGDTKTPARVVAWRVSVSVAVGLALMFPLDRQLVGGPGATLSLGPVGIALGTSVGAWLEWAVLSRKLKRRIGIHSVPARGVLLASGLAVFSALTVLAIPASMGFDTGILGEWLSAAFPGGGAAGDGAGPLVAAAITLLPYCVLYLVLDRMWGDKYFGAAR